MYFFQFPSTRIGLGSFIDNNSRVGSGIVIGQNSRLINSIVDNQILIGNNNIITNSHIGSFTNIFGGCSIRNTKLESRINIYDNNMLCDVEIGSFTYLSFSNWIDQAKIGRFCSIGRDLICGHGNHPTNWISTSPVFFSTKKQCGISFSDQDKFSERSLISIGNDVWIGDRVFIKDCIKIGDGAIIGAGSVITKNVPDYAIVAGVPARVIRFRFSPEQILQLLEIKWWNWDENRLRNLQPVFSQSSVDEFIKAALPGQ